MIKPRPLLRCCSAITRPLDYDKHSFSPLVAIAKKHKDMTKKRWIERNWKVLDAHKNRRLKLASELGQLPYQYEFPPEEQKPTKIVTKERALPPLKESQHPYKRYTPGEIQKYQSFGTFYDPLFNPHLSESSNTVNPDEDPFNAIYVGNESTEGGQQYTQVRNVTSPILWSFVERLARHKIAPEVRRRKPGEPITKLPSGFVPPPEEPPNLPYFVSRTRNHLLPVYYNLDSNPDRCVTVVKFISGDIWKFEEDLRKHLESLNETGEKILSSVQEPDERVIFRGKHLNQIVDWLHESGF